MADKLPIGIQDFGSLREDGYLYVDKTALMHRLDSDPFENYFQAVIWLVFTLLGRFARCEMRAASGRVDVVVGTERYIYVMELKRDGTAEEALAQIEERGYTVPFAADPCVLYRIGAAFDSETRRLSGWLAV